MVLQVFSLKKALEEIPVRANTASQASFKKGEKVEARTERAPLLWAAAQQKESGKVWSISLPARPILSVYDIFN